MDFYALDVTTVPIADIIEVEETEICAIEFADGFAVLGYGALEVI
jgi:hypothetical protein